MSQKIEKIIIQSRASKSDPSFEDQVVGEYNFFDYFQEHGIRTLKEDLIISCHGNTELDVEYAKRLQRWATTERDDEDDENIGALEEIRIASIQSGGLYFAKPSLEAANMPTIPVISIPLDLASFMAPMVPSGTACIAGVGMNDYENAARFAKEILTNSFDGVYVYKPTDKLEKRLDELGVEIIGEHLDCEDGLIVGKVDSEKDMPDFNKATIGIFTTNSYHDFTDIDKIETCLDYSKNSVYVRGEDNLAFFAAKCLSFYNGRIFNNLIEVSRAKAETYDIRKLIMSELTGVENEREQISNS